MRQIAGLKSARMLEGQPPFHVSTRSVGVKNIGIRYEKDLAKGLGAKFKHGQWWEYRDVNGQGWCQTDFFGRAKDWIILLESKLTWTQEAERQLNNLYIPVVSCALKIPERKILSIVVCKYLTKEVAIKNITHTLKEALSIAMDAPGTMFPVWHHFGGVPRLMEERGYERAAS